MKNKIRKIAGGISVALMAAPSIVMAQSFIPQADLPTGSVTDIVRNFMRWILIIVGILGVIGFAIAGILYLTAAGDDDRMQTAKKSMIYSIIGIIVAMLGLVIMTAVFRMLSAQSGF
ncbi:MAG: pilin [Patescibacteria group bacterium]